MLPKRFPDRVEIAAVRAAARAGRERRDARRRAARRGPRHGAARTGEAHLPRPRRPLGRIQLIVAATERLSARPRRHRRRDRRAGDARGAASRRSSSSQVELLAKIRKPLPDTFHGVTDREHALPAALPRPADERGVARAVPRRATQIVGAIRAYLDGEGFLEVETPILQPRYGGALRRAVRHALERARRRTSTCASPTSSTSSA